MQALMPAVSAIETAYLLLSAAFVGATLCLHVESWRRCDPAVLAGTALLFMMTAYIFPVDLMATTWAWLTPVACAAGIYCTWVGVRALRATGIADLFESSSLADGMPHATDIEDLRPLPPVPVADVDAYRGRTWSHYPAWDAAARRDSAGDRLTCAQIDAINRGTDSGPPPAIYGTHCDSVWFDEAAEINALDWDRLPLRHRVMADPFFRPHGDQT